MQRGSSKVSEFTADGIDVPTPVLRQLTPEIGVLLAGAAEHEALAWLQFAQFHGWFVFLIPTKMLSGIGMTSSVGRHKCRQLT